MDSSQIIRMWTQCCKLPGGKTLFSKLIATKIPYTGSIPFKVLELQKGKSLITMKDGRKVRNHFDCVHAIALANLAELSSGISLSSAIPKTHRCILTNFKIEYLKKARGQLHASSEFQWTPSEEKNFDRQVLVKIKNGEGETVSVAEATWRIQKIK